VIAVGVDNALSDLDLTNVTVDYEAGATNTINLRGTHGSLPPGSAQTITIAHTSGTRVAAASFL
jgi:hypothetical protein